jgi:tyrosine aminotransferase
MPKGAMYMFLGVDVEKFKDIASSIDFMRKLAEEESVFLVPSECFNYPGFLRIVISSSEEILSEAADRIAEFAYRHNL